MNNKKKHVGSVIQVMAFFINEFKDTILRFFFFLNYEEKILNVNWDLSQIYYNENLIFIDI